MDKYKENHTYIYHSQTAEEQKNLKASRKKGHRGTIIRMSADFSSETIKVQKTWNDICKMLEEKRLSKWNFILSEIYI